MWENLGTRERRVASGEANGVGFNIGKQG